jgi:hypothetical protein
VAPYGPARGPIAAAQRVRDRAGAFKGEVEVCTLVVGAPSLVTEKELAEQYPNPVRLAAGADLTQQLERATNGIFAQPKNRP